mmetsp:Transcript_33072/g.77157  ORF Transcript_33072/g.77157 Transcript_33072/m.77157 type:complete len:223 (-) Transcript_33072:182-850(-)
MPEFQFRSSQICGYRGWTEEQLLLASAFRQSLLSSLSTSLLAPSSSGRLCPATRGPIEPLVSPPSSRPNLQGASPLASLLSRTCPATSQWHSSSLLNGPGPPSPGNMSIQASPACRSGFQALCRAAHCQTAVARHQRPQASCKQSHKSGEPGTGTPAHCVVTLANAQVHQLPHRRFLRSALPFGQYRLCCSFQASGQGGQLPAKLTSPDSQTPWMLESDHRL